MTSIENYDEQVLPRTKSTPTKAAALKKKRQREKRAQVAADLRAGKLVPATSPEADPEAVTDSDAQHDSEDMEVVEVAPTEKHRGGRVVSPRANKTFRPSKQLPTVTPPPSYARSLSDGINGVFLRLVYTLASVLKGILHVLGFLFILLEKPMCVTTRLAITPLIFDSIL